MAVYQEKDKSKWTKDGRSWYFRCYYTDLLGNRKQKESSKYFTKKETLEAERLFLSSLTDLSLQKNITFKQLKEEYLRQQKERLKITSYQTLKLLLSHIEPIDNIVIEKLTINQFNNWKSIINSKDFSTGYKNNIYKRLRSLLNFGNKMYNIDTRIMNKFTNFTRRKISFRH